MEKKINHEKVHDFSTYFSAHYFGDHTKQDKMAGLCLTITVVQMHAPSSRRSWSKDTTWMPRGRVEDELKLVLRKRDVRV
jgi:hypothetical protein